MSDGGFNGAGDATFDCTLASEHSVIGQFVIPRKRIRLNFQQGADRRQNYSLQTMEVKERNQINLDQNRIGDKDADK